MNSKWSRRVEHFRELVEDTVEDTAISVMDRMEKSKHPTKKYIKSTREEIHGLSFAFLLSITLLAIIVTLVVIFDMITPNVAYSDTKTYSSTNESIIYNSSKDKHSVTLSKDYTEDLNNKKISYMLSTDPTEDEEFIRSGSVRQNSEDSHYCLTTIPITGETESEIETEQIVEIETEAIKESTPIETEVIETEVQIESETERVRVIPCTDEERLVAQYIVEMEAHDLSYEHKQRIMGVIVNRMYSEIFPNQNTLLEVMTAPDQFSSLFNFYNPVFYPNEDTINAVDSIIYGDADLWDVSQGALFFYNPDRSGGYISFFEDREYIDSMDGHRFFR